MRKIRMAVAGLTLGVCMTAQAGHRTEVAVASGNEARHYVLAEEKGVEKLNASQCMTLTQVAPLAAACAPKRLPGVQRLIEAMKSNNRTNVTACVAYPLQVGHPLAPIRDAAALLARYDEVFDAGLSKTIAESDPAASWSKMGENGIMLENGLVWLRTDGLVMGINHETDVAKKLKADRIAEQKAILHESVREFVAPVLECRTSHFIIRIDDLGKGEFRLAT